MDNCSVIDRLKGANGFARPVLALAPMEGVTNSIFRNLICEIGGVDLVATEFVRITSGRQKIRPFVRHPQHRVALQIQLMASEGSVLAENIEFLKQRGVLDDGDWLDLNVGCPSKRVNAHGAGAALLLEPSKLLEMVHRMRAVHKGPLSLKTRVGYQSAEDYPNILKCLAKCPLDFVTIHARTRCGQYTEPVNWNYLRKAVQILPFSVLGNGEVWSADDALRMLEQTGVHGIMCGRGVIRDPFLFARICAKLTGSAPPFAGRGELLKLAAELARRYAQADSDRKVGVFKEFAGWLSKNPCMGRELFLGVKRLQTFSEILDALERLSVSSENKESLSRKYQGVREGRI